MKIKRLAPPSKSTPLSIKRAREGWLGQVMGGWSEVHSRFDRGVGTRQGSEELGAAAQGVWWWVKWRQCRRSDVSVSLAPRSRLVVSLVMVAPAPRSVTSDTTGVILRLPSDRPPLSSPDTWCCTHLTSHDAVSVIFIPPLMFRCHRQVFRFKIVWKLNW